MGKRKSSTSRRSSTKSVKKNKNVEKEETENVDSDQQNSQEEVEEFNQSQQEENETLPVEEPVNNESNKKDESTVSEEKESNEKTENMDISTHVVDKDSSKVGSIEDSTAAPNGGTFNVEDNNVKTVSEEKTCETESDKTVKESEKSRNIVDLDDFDATNSQLEEAEKLKSSPAKEAALGKENLGIRSGSEVIKDLIQDLADMNRLITRAKNELHETRMKINNRKMNV